MACCSFAVPFVVFHVSQFVAFHVSPLLLVFLDFRRQGLSAAGLKTALFRTSPGLSVLLKYHESYCILLQRERGNGVILVKT